MIPFVSLPKGIRHTKRLSFFPGIGISIEKSTICGKIMSYSHSLYPSSDPFVYLVHFVRFCRTFFEPTACFLFTFGTSRQPILPYAR